MEKLPVENTAQKVGLKNKLAFASGDIFRRGQLQHNKLSVRALFDAYRRHTHVLGERHHADKQGVGRNYRPVYRENQRRKTAGQIRQTPFLHARVRAHTHCGDHSFVFPWNLVIDKRSAFKRAGHTRVSDLRTTQSFILIP